MHGVLYGAKYKYSGSGYQSGSTFTHTYYTYRMSDYTNDEGKLTLINDFFMRTNPTGVWLASQYTQVNVSGSSCTGWGKGFRYIYSGVVEVYHQYMHNDSGNYSDRQVCAVVTLKPTVNLTEASTTERIWNIQ